MSTVPTAATERASYLQAKAAPPAGCLTPENLPVSLTNICFVEDSVPFLRLGTGLKCKS
jgi:hypothetical protein